MTQEPQLTRSVDDPEAPHSWGTRFMRAIAVPGRLLQALFLPDRGMPNVVAQERAGAALVTLVICAALAAYVLAVRVDTSAMVMQGETMRMQMEGPQAEARSDRELQEEIDKSTVMTQVTMGLKAGGWVPIKVCLLTLGLALAGWFVGGKPKLRKSFAAMAHASLPYAVKSIAVAVLAWPRSSLTPMDVDKLQSFSEVSLVAGPLARFFTIDVFTVWFVILAGFGLAAAASITRRRAFTTMIILFFLALLISGAQAGGPGGPGGPGPMPPRG